MPGSVGAGFKPAPTNHPIHAPFVKRNLYLPLSEGELKGVSAKRVCGVCPGTGGDHSPSFKIIAIIVQKSPIQS